MNYGDAKAQCESDGSFLAIPRSEAENEFFASLIPNENFWIGINDIEQEGSFVGVDGSEISYTNWRSGQPNGGVDQNGVEIWNGLYYGTWNDREVNVQKKFICSIYIEGIIFKIFNCIGNIYHNRGPSLNFSFKKSFKKLQQEQKLQQRHQRLQPA